MRGKLLSAIAIAVVLGLWCSAPALAQSTSLPLVTHSRPTMMGAKAQSLQTQVAQEIDKAKAAGTDVSGCAYVATLGDTGTGTPLVGFINVAGDSGDAHSVVVQTFDTTGLVPTDGSFHLSVSCPQ